MTTEHRKKHLNAEEEAKMRYLLKAQPRLTNLQIAKLVGCSDSTVAAERRGDRAPSRRAKEAAFEVAKASLDTGGHPILKAQLTETTKPTPEKHLGILSGALRAADRTSFLQGVLAGTQDEEVRDLVAFYLRDLGEAK